jgi:hypothetical protein
MLNFESFVARHGEFGVEAIIEHVERREGRRWWPGASLQDRWDAMMDKCAVADANRAARR